MLLASAPENGLVGDDGPSSTLPRELESWVLALQSELLKFLMPLAHLEWLRQLDVRLVSRRSSVSGTRPLGASLPPWERNCE